MGRMIGTAEAAKRLGLAAATLRVWRCEKRGPSFVQYGPNSVVYDEDDIQEYVKAHRVDFSCGHARENTHGAL